MLFLLCNSGQVPTGAETYCSPTLAIYEAKIIIEREKETKTERNPQRSGLPFT